MNSKFYVRKALIMYDYFNSVTFPKIICCRKVFGQNVYDIIFYVINIYTINWYKFILALNAETTEKSSLQKPST